MNKKNKLYEYFTFKFINDNITYSVNINKGTFIFVSLLLIITSLFVSFTFLNRNYQREIVKKAIMQKDKNVSIKKDIYHNRKNLKQNFQKLKDLNEEFYTIIFNNNIANNLDYLEFFEKNMYDYDNRLYFMLKIPEGAPAKGILTSNWGFRKDPFNNKIVRFHTGVDIANKDLTPIIATHDGYVTHTDYDPKFINYGKVVFIDNGFYQTLYAHLSSTNVKIGEKINKKTVIGYMGDTGASTGTHLHYEILFDYVPKNPNQYIRKIK